MSTTLGPSPGAQRHLHHTINVRQNIGQLTARLDQQQLANSRRTLVVEEYGYKPVVYFPVDDVRTELLECSDSRSICPFKGEARYFKLAKEELQSNGHSKDVAWYYPVVYDEVAQIAGYVAFYTDQVEIVSDNTHEQ